jgi:hypothetical protein
METMETYQDETAKPDKTWHSTTKGMGICKYKERVLAHSQEPNPASKYIQ